MKINKYLPKRIKENFQLDEDEFDITPKQKYPMKGKKLKEEDLRHLLRDEIMELLQEDSLDEAEYTEKSVQNAEKIAKIELDAEKKKASIKQQSKG